jgi:diguanylate cyclase (GGDEF)-like protein
VLLDGVPLASLVVEHQHADLSAFLRSVAREDPRRPASIEVDCRRADECTVPVELTGANLLGNPDVGGIVVTMRDVSARRELEEQLRHQAFHDALTGLANRALFADRLERAMRVRRTADDLAPAVAFIDLDDFKEINDNLGHAVGDAVLAAIANRIAGCLRGSDTAARLGGDEFALLIEDVPDERSLHELVGRVVDSISQPIAFEEGHVVRMRASVGIAASGADVVTADDLLRHADLAMYRDKGAAKAVVVDG